MFIQIEDGGHKTDPAFPLCFSSVVSLTGRRDHAQLLPESYPKGQVHKSVFLGFFDCVVEVSV